MNRFFFTIFTLIIGMFVQFVLMRYLSIYGAAPQLLLLSVVAFGFLCGPVMGEAFGFMWGLITDAMGVSLFGLNAFVLTLAGYLAGSLRRRVASERTTGQFVIAVVATLYYWVISGLICSLFDESKGQTPHLTIALEILINVVFVSGVFWVIDQWVDFWRLEREHM